MFKDLAKRISTGQRSVHVESHVGKVYAQVMDSSIITPNGRGPEYRPSSFPICPILVHMQFMLAAEHGYYQSNMAAGGGYFTSVGTAAHENIQYYMGPTKKVFGDWKCRNPRCQKHHDARDLYDEKGVMYRKGKLTSKNTTENDCPECGVACEYVEKCIDYFGLKGHIDCIYEMPDGTYWVMDYKTTTKGLMKGNKLPKREHLMQVPTYCYVLEKKYGMKISGFSLLYLSRDNPYEFKEKAERWGERRREETRKLIIQQKKIYRSAVNSFIQNKPELAIKTKPCQCPDDYERLMPAYEPCPMEKVCFNKQALKDNMLHALKPEQLIKVTQITNNMVNYLEEEHMPKLAAKKTKKLKADMPDLKLPGKKKKSTKKVMRISKK